MVLPVRLGVLHVCMCECVSVCVFVRASHKEGLLI
jgi:hypothetical protein